jgi:zinc protease
MKIQRSRPGTGFRNGVLGFLVLIGAGSWGCAGGLGAQHAWEQPPPALKQGPVVSAEALTRVRLDNGLTVIVLEDHRLPTVSLGVTVRSGAGSVPRDRAGLAPLVAELMNRGAGDRDALALAEAVDALGASLSVSAGWDSMSVDVSGLSRDLDFLLSILADVVLEPRFDAAEFEKARTEQLAALEAANDNPAELVRREAMEILYPKHRYGLPTSGRKETIESLDREAVRDLHRRFFVPGNAIVSVSGDVDADRFVAALGSVFGGWSAEAGAASSFASTPAPPAITPGARRILIADKPDLNQARIIIAHEGIARKDPRRIIAGLMNATLGGSGFSSRLMAKLRSEEGLTYGVRSGFGMRSQPGPFSISTFTRVAETRRAVDLLLEQLEGMRKSNPQSPAELADAKSYNVGQFGLGLETSAAVTAGLVSLDVYGLPADSLDTYRARVSQVTAAQTRRVAEELLHPSRAAIILLGPANVLAPQFEDMGRVEVVKP